MSTAGRLVSASIASWIRIGVTVISQVALVPIYLQRWDHATYGSWLAIQTIYGFMTLCDISHHDFLGFEFLRLGRHPKDAAIEACKRIRTNTVEKRLLDQRGNTNFDVTFYVLDAKGRHAGVSLLSGAKYAVCTENGPETLVCEALFERKPAG